MNIPKINRKQWSLGPGLIITAAFIGPGTITMCTISGAKFGLDLLWVIGLAVIGTYVLQEMSARLGIVTRLGLVELIRNEVKIPVAKILSLLLIILAIAVGNAAYEGGNIAGAVLGIESFGVGKSTGVLVLGGFAFLILITGKYHIIEKVLIGMVGIMSLTFIVAAIMSKPDLMALFSGFIPQFDQKYSMDILALIGTTIVPYNLFLHGTIARQKWKNKNDIPAQKRDSMIAIILGGVVSASIIIVSSGVSPNFEINNVQDLSRGLSASFGDTAQIMLGVGLLAAGLTSAITAPLATAYVVTDCFSWKASMKDWKFRSIWIAILGIGMSVSVSGFRPIEVIRLAQIFNAILLPLVAIVIVWLSQKKRLLGAHKNSVLQSILGVVMIIITILLSLRLIW